MEMSVQGPRAAPRDDVKKVADDQRLVRSASRWMSRCLRSSARLTAGSRILAALSALAIFIGAQSPARFERLGSPATELVAALSAPTPALHSVPTVRVVAAPRSVSRLPDTVAAALLASPDDGLRVALVACDVTHDAIEPPCGSVASRGYDATAPPALS